MDNWPVMNDSREQMELDREDLIEVGPETNWKATVSILVSVPVVIFLIGLVLMHL